jgi:hypothetical protein
MERRFNSIQDRRGNALAGATVTVTDENGGAATIYSDDGVTTTDNPLTTNADGEYTYFATNGKYTEAIVKEGYGSETITDLVMYDPDESSLSVDEITTATYAFSSADAGKWLDFDTAGTATATMTTASGYTGADTTIISQKGAGQVVLAAGSGVTLRTADTSKTRDTDSVIAITRIAAHSYLVYGDMEEA